MTIEIKAWRQNASWDQNIGLTLISSKIKLIIWLEHGENLVWTFKAKKNLNNLGFDVGSFCFGLRILKFGNNFALMAARIVMIGIHFCLLFLKKHKINTNPIVWRTLFLPFLCVAFLIFHYTLIYLGQNCNAHIDQSETQTFSVWKKTSVQMKCRFGNAQ